MAKKNEEKKPDEVLNKENIEEKNEEVKKPVIENPLEVATRMVAEYKDMALRARADYDNLRKNNINIVKDTRDRVVSEVIEDVLPVIDSIDRAEAAITDKVTLDGLAIIKEQMQAVLKRYEVIPIEAKDKKFNPNFHNCIMQVESPEKVDMVVYEIQKGYMIKDRVLRHSFVAVGTAAKEKKE